MKRISTYGLILMAALFGLNACATYSAQEVGPTPILQARQQIPEEALMDVGIEVFQSAPLTEDEAKDQGTSPEIRKAEGHFIPYHLKNTMQRSSHWGAVRVLPMDAKGADVIVRGQIIESNGEQLVLRVEAVDASGNLWLNKTYKMEADQGSYTGNAPGEKDAFQDLYNAVANDLAAYKNSKAVAELANIRRISKLQFASDFAPEIFGGYLQIDKQGKATILRLPSDDDPMMERLLQIRERDNMYVDTLNEYYDGCYDEMWPAYQDWRKANQAEQVALRKIRMEATKKMLVGALIMAAGIALGASDAQNTGALSGMMVVGGGAVMVDGYNVSKEAEIHRVAIQELSESFGNEMKPMVMEFQGKKYELTGSAEEQYKKWRELLRKIYYAETGFVPEGKAPEGHPKAD